MLVATYHVLRARRVDIAQNPLLEDKQAMLDAIDEMMAFAEELILLEMEEEFFAATFH